MRQTVFTPTYNRADTLPRLWESIKKQTFKDFVWLIVHDGSSDNTKQVVEGFIAENVISVKYIYKPNGGKHTAQWLAYHEVETPYLTEIDSDDTLMEDAVESFEKAWTQIEKEMSPIAKVSLFCEDTNGNIVGYGSYTMPDNIVYSDATWQEYVLKDHNHRELVSSLDVRKFLDCYNVLRYDWFSDKVKCLYENVIWACLGRNYKTRIVNKVGRIVYLDASNSILRGTHNYYNDLVGSYYFVEENIKYFWWNPRYFLGEISHYTLSCKELNFSFREGYSRIHSAIFKLAFIAIYLFAR